MLTAGQPLLITTGDIHGGAVVVGVVTDRKSIGPLSKFLQRSSMFVRISHSDVKCRKFTKKSTKEKDIRRYQGKFMTVETVADKQSHHKVHAVAFVRIT